MSKKMGRPKIQVNWDLAKSMAEIHCTGQEIAHVLGIHYDTLIKKIKKEFKYKTFAEWFEVYSAGGKRSLRRLQWEAAQKGNITMLIFLGKNWLNQTNNDFVRSNNEPLKEDNDELKKIMERRKKNDKKK